MHLAILTQCTTVMDNQTELLYRTTHFTIALHGKN